MTYWVPTKNCYNISHIIWAIYFVIYEINTKNEILIKKMIFLDLKSFENACKVAKEACPKTEAKAKKGKNTKLIFCYRLKF